MRLVVTPAFDPKTMTWFVDESSSPVDIGDVESLAEMQKRLPRGAEIVGYRTNSNVIGVASRRPPSKKNRPSLFSTNLNAAPSDAYAAANKLRKAQPAPRVASVASPWSPEEKEMLNRMVKSERRSQAEIVKAIGTKTRNQVAGRIYRLRRGQP